MATDYIGTTYFNGYRIAAWLTHTASWLTTYWLCEWIAAPAGDQEHIVVAIISLAGEFVLHRMKTMLFDASKKNDAIGWAGFALDTLINAGGALPSMGRLAAWPPLVALVRLVGADSAAGPANRATAFALALVVGLILSALPIRLDQMADAQP